MNRRNEVMASENIDDGGDVAILFRAGDRETRQQSLEEHAAGGEQENHKTVEDEKVRNAHQRLI